MILTSFQTGICSNFYVSACVPTESANVSVGVLAWSGLRGVFVSARVASRLTQVVGKCGKWLKGLSLTSYLTRWRPGVRIPGGLFQADLNVLLGSFNAGSSFREGNERLLPSAQDQKGQRGSQELPVYPDSYPISYPTAPILCRLMPLEAAVCH